MIAQMAEAGYQTRITTDERTSSVLFGGYSQFASRAAPLFSTEDSAEYILMRQFGNLCTSGPKLTPFQETLTVVPVRISMGFGTKQWVSEFSRFSPNEFAIFIFGCGDPAVFKASR